MGVTNNLGGTDATQRFDAWGNQIAATGTQSRYGYTGREPDETGLVYYRARYYDPNIGRFTQRDPMGLAAGINLYAYVNGNPINFNDPDGLLANQLLNAVSNYYGSATDTLTNAGQNLKAFAQTSVDAARSESIGDALDRVIQGSPVGPEFAAVGAAVGSIKSVKLGQAGEQAVREVADIGEKAAFQANGNNRIADGLNRALKTITEIKNTATQAFTSQLRDYVTYAQQQGMQFDLYVRESTVLSGPLKDAIHSGLINLNFIPKP